MPTLKPSHEAFCHAYVANPNATLAARGAGFAFEHANQQGYRLMRRATIQRRIAELRAELAERECLAPGALLSKLEPAFHAAIKKDQPAAAARVVEAQVKIVSVLAKSGAVIGAPLDGEALARTRAALESVAKQLGLPAPRYQSAT